ncbi:MAG TPA: hypothetical protein VIJ97_04385 [Candidatus Anoxymicrobiaceae bacterium]
MPVQCPRCGAYNEDGRQACAVCAAAFAVPAAAGPPVVVSPGAPDPGATASVPPREPEKQGNGSGKPSASGVQQPAAAQARQQPQAPAPPQAPVQQQASTQPQAPAPTQVPMQQAPAPPGPPPAPFAPMPTAAAEKEAPDAADGESEPAAPVEEARVPAPEAEAAPEAPAGEIQAEQPPHEPQAAAQPYPEPQPWTGQATGYPGYGFGPYGPYPQPYFPDPMQAYGYGLAMMSPYGAYGPYPAFGFFPPMPFFGGYPPYGSPYMQPFAPPPGAYPPAPYGAPAAPYPGAYPQQQYPASHKRMKTVYIILIILGVLLLIGGAVTAAILLTGNGKSSFNLGDGTVTGVDISFSNLLLRQSGSTVTLTGKYSNNTKRKGDVYISVQGISKGAEQLINFTVPVQPGKGRSFSQKKSSASTLSGATLGTLIYESSTGTNPSGSDTYPWETSPTSPTTPGFKSQPTTPGTAPESSPFDEQNDTSPQSTTPTF